MTSNNSHDWKLEGDYFEGCNCDSICPCILLLDPDKGYCNLTIAWHIEKGHYDSIPLDGLNAVAVFVAPGNMFTGPKMKVAFYVDKKCKPRTNRRFIKYIFRPSGGFFCRSGEIYRRDGWNKICSDNFWNGRKTSLAANP